MKSRHIELLNLIGIDTCWYKEELHSLSNKSSLQQLRLEADNCHKCKLHETRNNVVFGDGDEKAEVLIIGEAPGQEEDKSGKPFVGRAGKLLTEILFSMGLSRESVYITNTVKCRPPENRNPTTREIHSCASFLDQQIKIIQPKIIILLGKIAAERVLCTSEPMSSLRGKVHRYKDFTIPIYVFYHPAYLLRSPSEKRKVWDDILLMKENLNVT